MVKHGSARSLPHRRGTPQANEPSSFTVPCRRAGTCRGTMKRMTSRMLLRHSLLAPLASLLAPGIRFGQTCQPQLHIHHMLLLHPVCGQSRHRQMLPRLSKHTVVLPNHQHLLRTTTKPNMRMLLQMRPRRLMCARSNQQLHLKTLEGLSGFHTSE